MNIFSKVDKNLIQMLSIDIWNNVQSFIDFEKYGFSQPIFEKDIIIAKNKPSDGATMETLLSKIKKSKKDIRLCFKMQMVEMLIDARGYLSILVEIKERFSYGAI